jgi:hypothetical protein
VLDLQVVYCTEKDILSFHEWLCFSCIIHNSVLSSFWYYSHVFLCRLSMSMAAFWHWKPAPAFTSCDGCCAQEHDEMDTMCICISYSKGLSNQNFVCNSFFFLLCYKFYHTQPPWFIHKDIIENIFRLSHSVLLTPEVIYHSIRCEDRHRNDISEVVRHCGSL